jgi:hypothetical protein
MEGVGQVRVCLEGRRLSLNNDKSGMSFPSVDFLPDGTFMLGPRRFPYSLDGDRLTIRGLGKGPLTLRPAAPRKP